MHFYYRFCNFYIDIGVIGYNIKFSDLNFKFKLEKIQRETIHY